MSHYDHAYKVRVQEAVLEAAFKAAIDQASNTMVMRVPELVDVMIDMAATFLATNDRMSRTALRERCDAAAKRLLRQTLAGKEVISKTGLPFDVIHLEERH